MDIPRSYRDTDDRRICKVARVIGSPALGPACPVNAPFTPQETGMGLFKQMKDMKNVVEQAPGMVAQAQQLGAQAQEMAAAQQAAAQQAMAQQQAASATAAQAGVGDFEPINGVTIEQYAAVSKQLADHGYDQSKAAEVAATNGIAADDWQAAMDGWNQRMQGSPAVGQRFNALYTGR